MLPDNKLSPHYSDSMYSFQESGNAAPAGSAKQYSKDVLEALEKGDLDIEEALDLLKDGEEAEQKGIYKLLSQMFGKFNFTFPKFKGFGREKAEKEGKLTEQTEKKTDKLSAEKNQQKSHPADRVGQQHAQKNTNEAQKQQAGEVQKQQAGVGTASEEKTAEELLQLLVQPEEALSAEELIKMEVQQLAEQETPQKREDNSPAAIYSALIANNINNLFAGFAKGMQTLASPVATAAESVQKNLQSIKESLHERAREIGGFIQEKTEQIISGIALPFSIFNKRVLEPSTELLKKMFAKAAEGAAKASEALNKVMEAASQAMAALHEHAVKVLDKAVDIAMPIIQPLIKPVVQFSLFAYQAAAALADKSFKAAMKLAKKMGDALRRANEKLKKIAASAAGAVLEAWDRVLDKVKSLWRLFLEWLRKQIALLLNKLQAQKTYLQAQKTYLQEHLKKILPEKHR